MLSKVHAAALRGVEASPCGGGSACGPRRRAHYSGRPAGCRSARVGGLVLHGAHQLGLSFAAQAKASINLAPADLRKEWPALIWPSRWRG